MIGNKKSRKCFINIFYATLMYLLLKESQLLPILPLHEGSVIESCVRDAFRFRKLNLS